MELIIQNIISFLNSNFFLTITGTFVAAFAGAYGAQSIIEKIKKKESLVKEIRNTNAAITTAFSICNTSLSLKKQHIKSLKENYDKQKDEFLDFKSKLSKEKIEKGHIFEFQVDLQSIATLSLPVDILKKQLFERVSATGKILTLTTTLISSIQSLNDSIKRRNEFIKLCSQSSLNNDQLVKLYFGQPDAQGHIDNVYEDLIVAIYDQTNECIFFSNLLCIELTNYGKTLTKSTSNNIPKIHEVDFRKSIEQGLMPDQNDYADWLTMFQKE